MTPIGMFTKNTHRHDSSLVKIPPGRAEAKPASRSGPH